jgi:hypothetical protein
MLVAEIKIPGRVEGKARCSFFRELGESLSASFTNTLHFAVELTVLGVDGSFAILFVGNGGAALAWR